MSTLNHGDDLAYWLQEAGRRTWHRPSRPSVRWSPDEQRPVPRGFSHRTLLLGLLALSFLQYFYADALLQILTLPYLIVFVLAS
jgi:hypothetical protein